MVAWGNTVRLCERAASELEKVGVESEVIDLRSLSPWDERAVVASAERTARLMVVHEDNHTCGFGAEVLATVAEKARVPVAMRRVAAPTPSSPATSPTKSKCSPPSNACSPSPPSSLIWTSAGLHHRRPRTVRPTSRPLDRAPLTRRSWWRNCWFARATRCGRGPRWPPWKPRRAFLN